MIKATGIMACTHGGVIGKEGKLPWNYPEEFKHFQKTTKNNIIIMGRKTFDEMSKTTLLNNRFAIVFTKNQSLLSKKLKNVKFVNSLNEYKLFSQNFTSKPYMIGGQEIAKLFLNNNMIDKFILTKIHKEYEGDKFFPLNLIKNWHESINSVNNDYTIYNISNNRY